MNKINNEIQNLINKVNQIYNIKEIYVFGSYAYGTPTKDSDIDICIITEENNISKRELLKTIRRAIIDVVNKPVDILVYSKDEFQDRTINESTIEYKISTAGVKVYGQ